MCAGRLAAADGDFTSASISFSRACELSPGDPDCSLALGACLKHQHRVLDALPLLRSAHGQKPSNSTCRILADAEFEANHPELALPLFTHLLKTGPLDVAIRLRLAESHSQLGDNVRALEIIREGMKLAPGDADLNMAFAQSLEDEGDNLGAEEAYLSVLELRPAWPTAIAGLLGLKRAHASEDLIQSAQALLESPKTTFADKALLGYALGKALDGIKRYPEALRAWQIANVSREATEGSFDPQLLARHVQVLEDNIPPPPTNHPPVIPWQMIFVVGMPRSGTTLTETILSAHPAIHGCGELPDLPRLALELGPNWPELILQLPHHHLSTMREDYLRSASRHAKAGSKALVDKAPLNFFQLGLVQLLFPSARVIWCRRDRRDVALSIYGENFSPASRFSTSLDGITAYQDAEDKLLQMWQRTLSLPILVQDYEHLATDPHSACERLLDFIGLNWDQRMLQAHEVAGTVQTPSKWQVREPVHTRSIARWKNHSSLFTNVN